MNSQTLNAKSFAIRLLLFFLVAVGSIVLIRGIYALGPQSPESTDHERKLKTKDFKDMSVILVAVRNLQSETWYEDLEIELKNVSGKPIYFLTAYLVFPDEKLDWGESGIRLTWGDAKKLDTRKYAEPDAPYVEPGKTFVLTIPEVYRKGVKAKQRLRPHVTKNLILRFEKTYFGDGTGFEVENDWRDFREKGPPPKPEKKHHPNTTKGTEPSHPTTSTPEPICGGGNCFRWVVPDQTRPSSCYGCETIIASSSSNAPCRVLKQAGVFAGMAELVLIIPRVS